MLQMKGLVGRQFFRENAHLCAPFTHLNGCLLLHVWFILQRRCQSCIAWLTQGEYSQIILPESSRWQYFIRPLACNMQGLKEVGKGEEKPILSALCPDGPARSPLPRGFSLPCCLTWEKKDVAKGICPNIERGNFCSLEEIHWLTEVFPTKL